MEDNISVTNMTNQELKNLIGELEGKYQKLLKVANKLANEMDSLHVQYMAASEELNKRRTKK